MTLPSLAPTPIFPDPMNLSVVVPVYRGEALITPLVERLAPVLSRLAEEYEVILVSDDSPDNAWQVIENLARRYPWVIGLRLMRNYGQHNATLAGVRAAREIHIHIGGNVTDSVLIAGDNNVVR